MSVYNNILGASHELDDPIQIRRSSPFNDLVLLERHKLTAHLGFCDGNIVQSSYLPDQVASHRYTFELRLSLHKKPYDPEEYVTYEGTTYPTDLSRVPGLWSTPLEFTFDNLVVLNMDMPTAIYWAIPIIKATSTKLRRLILQRIDEYTDMPFAFPYTELDHCLVARPLVKAIMIYGHAPSQQFLRHKLPLLNLRGHIAFVEEGKLILFI